MRARETKGQRGAGPIESPFLLEQEAAAFLRCERGTLQNMRLAGRGPRFLKLGGRVLYDRGELEVWARAHTRGSTSDRPEAAA